MYLGGFPPFSASGENVRTTEALCNLLTTRVDSRHFPAWHIHHIQDQQPDINNMANRPATDPTIRNLGSTPVLFFPVPTAWPMSTGCSKNIYRQINGGSILAWDPIYPQIAASALTERRQSCFPTQQQSWHFQDLNAAPSTALGPAFVCPESYSAVAATVLESNSASRTEFTYCCPPYVPSSSHSLPTFLSHQRTNPPSRKYALNALPAPNTRSAIQWYSSPPPPQRPNPSTNPPRSTSLLPVGSILSFVSVTFTPTVIAPATTTTSVLAYIQSSTVVTATAETVYAVPINGYNIIAAAAADPEGPPDNRSTPTGGPADNTSTTTTATSPGTIAGAVVGGLVALALALALAYFVGRRRSSNRRRSRMLLDDGEGAKARAVVELPGGGGAAAAMVDDAYSRQQRRGWDDDKESPPYRYGVAPAPAPAHELPSETQRYELHGGVDAEDGAKGGKGGGYYWSG